MGQCVPFSETSEHLRKKSNVFRKISDIFWKKSHVFWGTSIVFSRASLALWHFSKKWEMQGEATDFLKPWAEIGGNAQGGLWAFSSLSRDKKGRCVLELLKVVRKAAANCWQLGCYKEICEGCESKKHKTPVGCAHACAREKAN